MSRPTTFNDQPAFRASLTAVCALAGLTGYLFESFHAELAVGLYALAYLAGAWMPLRETFADLRHRLLDVNFLMLLGAGGAALLKHPAEGVVLLFLFALSGTLEKYTLERTARTIESLVKLRPATALVLRDGVETRVPIEQVLPGDKVRVNPAERLPVDGEILEGTSSLDESTLTGESIPVDKGPGEEVFAGTFNHRGSLVVKATRASGESMLAKIVKLVGEARDEKTLTETRIARWQQPYVLGVLAATSAATLIQWRFFGQEFADAFYTGMTFLVAASPCAVMIATPSAVLAALTRAARSGVLFKSGAALERLADAHTLALDKTGTLTRGKPEVVALYESSGDEKQLERMLVYAASIEKRSEHALGQAVVDEANRRGLALEPVAEFDAHVGHGVHAVVAGKLIGVGREEVFAKHHIELPPALIEQGRALREKGLTALLVSSAGGPYGAIGIADRPRPEAAAALKALRGEGVARVVMLTGDHERVAQAVAKEVGVDTCRAGLLPGQKSVEIAALKAQHGAVCYVGDGVNDAPALAAADVGVAMGGAGTDVALETADVVLMRDDLRALGLAYWLSRRTRATIRRSLIFAFSVIVLLLVGAFLHLPLWLAVLAHEGSTVIAIFSGLYLLVEKRPEPAGLSTPA